MNIIIIAPSFFGYSQKIKEKLEQQGNTVFLFEDRVYTGVIGKVLTRLFPVWLQKATQKHYMKIADDFKTQQTTHVLIIKGESVSIPAIEYLKSQLSTAKFISYYWDSYKNMPKNAREKIRLFDSAFTFDMEDAKKDHRLSYRPLFFIDSFFKKHDAPKNGDIDLLFFGTVHSDRYKILKNIKKNNPDLKIKLVMYIPSKLIYFAKKITSPSYFSSKISEFIFKPIPSEEISDLIISSRGVVDIERKVQSGLTMRTIEILASGKKLVTTNSLIKQTDIYHPDNVFIIDRDNPIINKDFLSGASSDVPGEKLEKYSLNGWISDVFAWEKEH